MSHRSPGRFLAPLALLAAVATIYLVARPQLGGSSDGPSTPAASTSGQKKASTSAQGKAGAAKRRTGKGRATAKAAKTYTVKPGDVLGSISQATGVSVADLLRLNKIDDAQSLSVGQKLKLSP